MPHDFRVYGHLTGLSEAQAAACLDILSAYECEQDGHVLDFVHEGLFVDIDGDLERLLPVLEESGHGIVDIINHQDWEMHRITIRDGLLTTERIFLDNALDTAYASERKS